MSAKVDGKCIVFVGTSSWVGHHQVGQATVDSSRQPPRERHDIIIQYLQVYIYTCTYICTFTSYPSKDWLLCRNDAATAKRLVRKCTIKKISISIFNSNYWLRKHVAQILLARVISEKRRYVISSNCVRATHAVYIESVFCKCPMAAALVENPTHSV